jgi:fatty acid desaturase
MLPRHSSDYRTLFWTLVLFPVLPALAYAWPGLVGWVVPLVLYTSYCAGVLTHNHTHVPVFTTSAANHAHGIWLSIFYGCPIAFWIPTHLENHHLHLDGPGDVTRTNRRSARNDAWQALLYALACAHWQRPLIADYVRRAYARRGRHWSMLRDQATALVLVHAGMLALALALHGGAGALIYAASFGVPAALAPTFMQLTNYLQHVHCDPASADDHSRNFVSRIANWFVFDAGYHTVHHERPSAHWSRYAELHRARASRIDPSLCHSTVFSFIFDAYVLGAFSARHRTRPLAERARV